MTLPHALSGPVIALIGTLAVALIGFYQWRKQNGNPNRAANAAARREAYDGLWQKLEQINLDLREQRDDNPSLYARLREINTYFISHSLHFEDEDQTAVNDYIAAMSDLREKIYTSDDADVTSAYNKTWIEIPESLNAEINVALDKVKSLRADLKKRVQRVAATI